jgi:hypothetical protein
MKVIDPVIFAPAQLVSCTAVETAAAWASGTTYAKDAVVDYGTYYWISLANNNTGNQPDSKPAPVQTARSACRSLAINEGLAST